MATPMIASKTPPIEPLLAMKPQRMPSIGYENLIPAPSLCCGNAFGRRTKGPMTGRSTRVSGRNRCTSCTLVHRNVLRIALRRTTGNGGDMNAEHQGGEGSAAATVIRGWPGSSRLHVFGAGRRRERISQPTARERTVSARWLGHTPSERAARSHGIWRHRIPRSTRGSPSRCPARCREGCRATCRTLEAERVR